MKSFILKSEETRDYFIKWLCAQTLARPLDVKVKPWSKARSNPSNRRLFLLHTKAGNEIGETPKQMHKDCCCEYFGSKQFRMPSGYIDRKPIRTTTTNELGEEDTLPPDEFNQFMTWCETFYIETLGVWLE